MNIIKSGTPGTVQGRTCIEEKDLVIIYFPKSKEGNLLFSVNSHIRQGEAIGKLCFEGGDDKQEIFGYKSDAPGAYSFMMLIGQITGLTAKFLRKTDEFISFTMEKGDGLILHENDIEQN